MLWIEHFSIYSVSWDERILLAIMAVSQIFGNFVS